MSLTQPSPEATPTRYPLPVWRYAVALAACFAVWPAAWTGLYRFHSAPMAFLGYHAVCALGAVALRAPGLPVRDRLFPFKRRMLLAAVMASNVIILAAYLLVGEALLDRHHDLALLASRGIPPSVYWLLFPYFALVNPVVEELFWRGGVYATFRHAFRHWQAAALASSVFFGAWHWLVVRLFVQPWAAIAATIAIMGIGYALAAVYEHTRRMAYSVILHALAGDVPLLLLLLLLGRG